MGIGAEGISFGERLRRRALKRRVIRSMRRYNPGTETFPGLGPHPEFPEQEQFEISFPADLVLRVAQKIVRGCEYRLAQRIIDETLQLGVYFAHESDVAEQVASVFEGRSAQTTHLGPGFTITRAAAHDDPNWVVYRIIIWGTITIYGSITPFSSA
jgi:hypothetical protein